MAKFKLYGNTFDFEAEKPLLDPETKEYLRDENGVIVTEVVNYQIREMASRDRDAFLNINSKRLERNAQGDVVGFKDHIGMYSKLLCRCTYNEKGKLIPEEEIQGWPTTTQELLFQEATKLNKLGKAEAASEESAGNG